MKLSVICSGYRLEGFRRLYDSIGKSFSQDWELIICGPNKPDFEKDNLLWIEDFGSPARCCQRALLSAKGEWISFATDDGYYLDGAIDGEFKILEEKNFDPMVAIAGKFYEDVKLQDPKGSENAARYQEKDDLYYIKTHTEAYSPLFRPDFLIFGQGLISRELLFAVGGFDCRFELMGMSFLEMSIRIQLFGCKSILTKMPVFYCEWSHLTPGHEVVQESYDQHDKALYQKIYRDPNNKPQIVVGQDNWQDSPRRWKRRWPYDVSLIMPTIRTHLLWNVYNSMKDSFHGTWELVLVGPNPIPQELLKTGNVTWIQSYRSPIACRQQALLASKGELICYAADDVTFIRASLDEAYQTVERENFDYKFVVAGKYLENVNESITDSPVMREDLYYQLTHHASLVKAMEKFPQDWLIVNTGFISRKLLMEVGGWDTDYEVCSMACIDLSMRLQNYGARIHLQHNPIFHSTWYRDRDGDHGPIHDAHTDHDLPMFLGMWEVPESIDRKIVDINKWQTTPEKWFRRFE